NGKGVIKEGTGEMTLNMVNISKVKVGVDVKGGNLTISGGEMTEVQTGITMSGSGKLTVRDRTRIEFMGEHGVKVESGVTDASLTNVTIRGEGTGKGVIKDGTGDLRMNNVGISGVQTGIQVSNGNLTVSGGTMTGVQTGIDMSGSGTLMVNSGARIEFTGEHGVKVQNGATANLTNMTIAGMSGGTGKGVIMDGKTLEMTNVGISNVEKGVYATGGNLTISGGSMTGVQTGITMSGSGRLTMDKGSIGFKGEHGVRVGSEVTMATITGTEITGGGQGTGVWMEGKTLKMEKVTISNVAMGVEATNGTLTMTKGEIGFMGEEGGYGVMVGELVTMATITGTKIRGEGSGEGTGVIKEGEGMMTMNMVNIS
uniref:hypothetical protein n=1 Tax=Bartonella bovis TaxID=155194 RepID=UPI001ABA1853